MMNPVENTYAHFLESERISSSRDSYLSIIILSSLIILGIIISNLIDIQLNG